MRRHARRPVPTPVLAPKLTRRATRRRRWRRVRGATCVVAVALLVTAGCGSGDEPVRIASVPGSAPASAGAPAPAPAAPIEDASANERTEPRGDPAAREREAQREEAARREQLTRRPTRAEAFAGRLELEPGYIPDGLSLQNELLPGESPVPIMPSGVGPLPSVHHRLYGVQRRSPSDGPDVRSLVINVIYGSEPPNSTDVSRPSITVDVGPVTGQYLPPLEGTDPLLDGRSRLRFARPEGSTVVMEGGGSWSLEELTRVGAAIQPKR